jgi:triosephosphate isomerase (TIM)
MPTPFIAGNWKMYTTAATARALAIAVAEGVEKNERVRVAVCPPFPYLQTVGTAIAGSRVALGAQDVYPKSEGAFTGEVSPTMLRDVGCRYVIVGHSERRHVLGESNELIHRKLVAALAAELTPILCVGETLAEREAGHTESVLDEQLSSALADVAAPPADRFVVAYEPVWAIGTGRNATPEQAEQAHRFLRRRLADIWSENAASEIPIQYGGSVKPENAASLLAQPDVDGALVGGASLAAEQFLAIVAAAG